MTSGHTPTAIAVSPQGTNLYVIDEGNPGAPVNEVSQYSISPATGKLTLHGVTKDISVDLKARLNGSNLEVNGTIPITFADYGISNPSGGPASVGDNGEIELLLVFQKTA